MVFDAFGDDGQAEGVGGLDHELQQFAGRVVGRVEEHLVDFDDVDGKVPQSGDGVVAGAEVVDADRDPEPAQLGEMLDGENAVDEHGFGDLENEPLGRDAGIG